MVYDEYNDIVVQWIEGVLENHVRDAELTLKYCNDIIDYGVKFDDEKLMGFGYYYIAETYYCLNDGKNFFDAIGKALSYLDKAGEWELVARSYNVLGITAMNRGNAPVALDYYLNGIRYCTEYNIPEVEVILNINCGALSLEHGRYKDARQYLKNAYDYMISQRNHERYHSYMICIYENLIECDVREEVFENIPELLDIIYRDHWQYADYLDKIGVLCSQALYYHKSGQEILRDECIEQIDSGVTENMTILDMFDDYCAYCELLLDCDKDKEFWHIVETLEPLIKSFNIINMQLREISLKIKYYRKHRKSAEYLQAAGLYYELSEKKEIETQEMINNMLNLRRNLEDANKEKNKVKIENEILAQKSEQDPLTKLYNRSKLNTYADEVFARAMEEGKPFAIEILDIDYFKEFNDNYGHQKGDECLLAITDVLLSMSKEHGAFCSRYGGDEFVLIYENTSLEQMKDYCNELKNKIMDKAVEHKYSKALPIVTISQGACCAVPERNNRVWDFLHVADDRLYEIKKQSRNSFSVSDLYGNE